MTIHYTKITRVMIGLLSRDLRDALTVPFVGKRLAQKIDEIVASGRLRRLEAVDKEKQQQAAAVCIVLVRSCSLGKS